MSKNNNKTSRTRLGRMLWIALGLVSIGLGALGSVLPFLPTVPFLLLAAFSLAKGSRRLHDKFTSSALYKKNLESYVNGRGMTLRVKLRIMSCVTLLMAFGAFMMLRRAVYIPCIVLALVWLGHLAFFIFGVRTLKEDDENGGER